MHMYRHGCCLLVALLCVHVTNCTFLSHTQGILHNYIHVHQYVTISGKINDKAGKKSFELRSNWESKVSDAPT